MEVDYGCENASYSETGRRAGYLLEARGKWQILSTVLKRLVKK